MPGSTKSSGLDIVFIGLAITSSWGNGHATTYRSLIKGLHHQGHRVTFLEHDQPWYAEQRDAPRLSFCDTQLYSSVEELRSRFAGRVLKADAVIVGSYVRSGAAVCDWVLETARGVRAFYDIDTPITLSCLRTDSCEYLRTDQIADFDLMLSFSGGSTLHKLESTYGSRCAMPLYCSVDVEEYEPRQTVRDVDLGYMGTYSEDRQLGLEALLNEPARMLSDRTFMVVGAQYPQTLQWPRNVTRVEHLPPHRHAEFYGRQRCTLNLTRSNMREAGHSPSVRLFEAAACGTPIISDVWPGLDEILEPGEEILLAKSAVDVVRCLQHMSDAELARIARAARERVLSAHSSAHRASQLVAHIDAARGRSLLNKTHPRAPSAAQNTVGL